MALRVREKDGTDASRYDNVWTLSRNWEVVKGFFDVYIKARPSMVLDLSWGEGSFWADDWWVDDDIVVEGWDKDIERTSDPGNPDLVYDWCEADERRIREASRYGYDVTILDPPYSSSGASGHGAGEQSRRSGTVRTEGGPKSVSEAFSLYTMGMYSAFRIAKKFVLIKCQPLVESGLPWNSLHYVFNQGAFYARQGWSYRAIAFQSHVARPQRLPQKNFDSAVCAWVLYEKDQKGRSSVPKLTGRLPKKGSR